MATSNGVIQGYTGVATVDAPHQIIVDAQAHGTGSEAELLRPVVDAIAHQLRPHTVLTADAGYHSETNLKDLSARQIPALIADQQMRKRDARFATQARARAFLPRHLRTMRTRAHVCVRRENSSTAKANHVW